MRPHKRPRNVLASGILLAGLVGVLIFNLVIVIDLPSRVYTAEQLAYLDYNRSRSISQVAPSWNIITDEGVAQPAILSYIRENRVRASLYARYEEQDGVSVTVYDLDFRGEYHLVYDGPASTVVELFFPFPDNLETLHEVRLLVDGEEPPEVQYTTSGIHWQAELRRRRGTPGSHHLPGRWREQLCLPVVPRPALRRGCGHHSGGPCRQHGSQDLPAHHQRRGNRRRRDPDLGLCGTDCRP